MKTNGSRKGVGRQNTGSDFQKMLEAVFEGYEKRGIAKLRKVEMPVKVFGPPQKRKVVFLENPWLDYAGTWTEIGGRMLIIEAKSTESKRLEIGEGGITANQMKNLQGWARAGAATSIVWHHRGDVRVITAATIRAAAIMDAKSFAWDHLQPTPKGEGWIIWDVLQVMASRA